MSASAEDFDVVILGAGPVGSTLALLLAGTQQRVLLVERRSLAAGRDDPRALALAEGARQLLAPLNAWPTAHAADATPIETIHISQSGGFGRALIDRQDYRLPALGYVVRYGALLTRLHQALAEKIAHSAGQIVWLENTEAQILDDESMPAPEIGQAAHHPASPCVTHAEPSPTVRREPACPEHSRRIEGRDPATTSLTIPAEPPFAVRPEPVEGWTVNKEGFRTLQLTDTHGSRHIRARLIVHAEGTPPVDQPKGIARRYDQRALIFEATLAQPHRQRAWERFTPHGPLALLPIGGAGSNRISVVYTVPENDADALLALDDAALQSRLQQAIGPQARFSSLGPRSSFPLQLRLRQPLTAQRELWIGNAAQTLHPVSGQGFNLGLRDAALLGQLLRDQTSADPGNAALLQHYSRRRQLDRYGTAGFTDGIVRIFSTPAPLLNVLRGVGLTALDLIGPLRHSVARRMIWGARAWP